MATIAEVVEQVRETPGLTQLQLIQQIGAHETDLFHREPDVLWHLVRSALHLALARGWVREEKRIWPLSYRYYVVEEEL